MPHPSQNESQMTFFTEVKEVVRSSVKEALNDVKRVRDPRRDLAKYPANMTRTDVATYLNCDPDHVTNLYDEGKLIGRNIASPGARKRELRFHRDDVAAYEAAAATRDFSHPQQEPAPNLKPERNQ